VDTFEDAIRRNTRAAVRAAHQTLAEAQAIECAARHLLRAQAALIHAHRLSETTNTQRALALTEDALRLVVAGASAPEAIGA